MTWSARNCTSSGVMNSRSDQVQEYRGCIVFLIGSAAALHGAETPTTPKTRSVRYPGNSQCLSKCDYACSRKPVRKSVRSTLARKPLLRIAVVET